MANRKIVEEKYLVVLNYFGFKKVIRLNEPLKTLNFIFNTIDDSRKLIFKLNKRKSKGNELYYNCIAEQKLPSLVDKY